MRSTGDQKAFDRIIRRKLEDRRFEPLQADWERIHATLRKRAIARRRWRMGMGAGSAVVAGLIALWMWGPGLASLPAAGRDPGTGRSPSAIPRAAPAEVAATEDPGPWRAAPIGSSHGITSSDDRSAAASGNVPSAHSGTNGISRMGSSPGTADPPGSTTPFDPILPFTTWPVGTPHFNEEHIASISFEPYRPIHLDRSLDLPMKPMTAGSVKVPRTSATELTFFGAAVWNTQGPATMDQLFGLEVLRTRKAWGIGAGLQYSSVGATTYLPAGNYPESQIRDSTYLGVEDNSYYAYTDSQYVDGNWIYLDSAWTERLDTVVMHDIDTVVVAHDMPARYLRDRYTYLNVPILMDVHVAMGRFRVGSRFGPVLGFLLRAQASLPAAEYPGYRVVEKGELDPFVLGYTLRPYLRYRLSSDMSIGVEAAFQGHIEAAGVDPAQRFRIAGVGAGFTWHLGR